LAESESKLGRFGGETAARVQRFADVFDHGQQSLTILCHNRPAWCHRARRRRYHAFTLTSATTLSPHGFPWLGTCADETKRSKSSDYSTVGSVDSNAAGRSRWSHRKRLAEILSRTSGHAVAAIGFPGPRAGQMADHSRLVAGCRAIVRPLDISRAPDRAGPQAATGPSQVQGEELWRRDRVTAGPHSVFEQSMPSDLIRGWTLVRVKKTRQHKR